MGDITTAAAAKMPCPMARTFAEKHGPNCEAGSCILWRWSTVSAEVMKDAVSKEMKRLKDAAGTGVAAKYHKQAVANVMADPDAHDVNLNPTHGHCGLGGKPEA